MYTVPKAGIENRYINKTIYHLYSIQTTKCFFSPRRWCIYSTGLCSLLQIGRKKKKNPHAIVVSYARAEKYDKISPTGRVDS